MFSRIHQKFGTAGFLLAIVALVAAVAGTAFAAAGLTGKQKKEVTKIAKKYAGKQGPQGPTGPQGPAGVPGKDGTNGTNGTNGTDGISPAGTAFTGAANGCQEGGVKFVGANTTVACNGVKGANGTNGKNVELGTPTGGECAQGGATVQVEGEPSTKKAICNGQTGFTSSLPASSTETGVFAVSGFFKNGNQVRSFAAFPIPLAAGLDGSHVHAVNSAGEEFNYGTTTFEPATVCTGSVAAPTAPAGHMCVYLKTVSGMLIPAPGIEPVSVSAIGDFTKLGTDTTGAQIVFIKNAEGAANAYGSWAVTAPTS